MIGFSVENNYPVPMDEAVRLLHRIGFDAVSFNWKLGVDLTGGIQAARSLDMPIHYLHAPQGAYHTLWTQDAPEMLQLILQTLEDCKSWSVPIYVLHTCSDFVPITPDRAIGERNFRRITDTAARYGITVAFENTARPSYLKALMELYADDPHVGYCWDSGHEQCYAPQEDFLAQYGDRLLVTHLNDNIGMSTPGEPNSADDLHLIPGDGIADWVNQLKRLRGANKVDILSFELKRVSKPNQKLRLYDDLSLAEYFEKVYVHALKLEDAYRRSW